MGRKTLERYLRKRISNSQEKINRDVQRSNQFLKSFKSFQQTKPNQFFKMTNRFNPSKNPSTNKKWLLKDLLIKTQELDNKLSKLESTSSKQNLEDWSAVLNRFAELAKRQATNDTKKVTRSLWKDAKSVYSELSFELVNHPSK